MADLDDAIRRIVAHEGAHAGGLAVALAQEGVEQQVGAGFPALEPGHELLEILERTVTHVGPQIALGIGLCKGVIEIATMLRGRYLFENDIAAEERTPV